MRFFKSNTGLASSGILLLASVNSPQTMLFTLFAGLKYPHLATAIGASWLFFRSLYLYGYVYSGKPQGKGRLLGGFFWFSQGALWALSVFGVAKDMISY